MKITIVGATGFVGKALARALVARGDAVTALVRDVDRARAILPKGPTLEALPRDREAWSTALAGADAVVNLAGEPVVGRWTTEKKAALRSSRVDLTEALVAGIAALTPSSRPRAIVQASAIGYYGGDNRVVDESSAPGSDLLARLCIDWEAAAAPATTLGVRLCLIRIGVVIGKGGGALDAMLTPFRLGVGGRVGSGEQWVSWIALDDLISMLVFAIDHDAASGPWNAVAPTPITNATLTRALGAALHRPTIAVVPAFALRAVFGEGAAVMLGGQKVASTRAAALGFSARVTSIEDAIAIALS